LPTRDQVDHGDRLRIREVDEDLLRASANLEAFGVRRQRHVRFAPSDGVDDGNVPSAVADEDAIGIQVKPNIVGIVAKVDLSRRRKVRTTEQAHGTIAAIGDKQHVDGRDVTDSLGFAET
jgi:hypothetical protein